MYVCTYLCVYVRRIGGETFGKVRKALIARCFTFFFFKSSAWFPTWRLDVCFVLLFVFDSLTGFVMRSFYFIFDPKGGTRVCCPDISLPHGFQSWFCWPLVCFSSKQPYSPVKYNHAINEYLPETSSLRPPAWTLTRNHPAQQHQQHQQQTALPEETRASPPRPPATSSKTQPPCTPAAQQTTTTCASRTPARQTQQQTRPPRRAGGTAMPP